MFYCTWSLFVSLFELFIIIYFSDRGEMCAMKEVTLFSDDPKSKESAKQLCQVCCFVHVHTQYWKLHMFIMPHAVLPLLTLLSHLTGNITSEPTAAPKHCAILWIWNCMYCCLQSLIYFHYSYYCCDFTFPWLHFSLTDYVPYSSLRISFR